MTEESFDTVFGVNVRGTLFTVQKLLPLMSDGASIILNSSVGATQGHAGNGLYAASKSTLRSFARTWTSDLKHRRIRVNVLSPGSIKTPSYDLMTQEFKDHLRAAVPLARVGTDVEIATAALFLASADSSYVTGIDLPVDGGLAQV